MEKETEEKIMWLVKQAKDEIFSTGEADISPLLKYIDEQLSKARREGVKEGRSSIIEVVLSSIGDDGWTYNEDYRGV